MKKINFVRKHAENKDKLIRVSFRTTSGKRVSYVKTVKARQKVMRIK